MLIKRGDDEGKILNIYSNGEELEKATSKAKKSLSATEKNANNLESPTESLENKDGE